jgi:1-deoxy-D-xylulose-5-phosphate synthase
VPDLVIMQPKDECELANMLFSATKWSRPVMLRYPRGCGPGKALPADFTEIPLGKAEVLSESENIQIWALGDMLPLAQCAAEKLKECELKAGIVNPRFIIPLDLDLLRQQAEKAQCIVTIENGVAKGGFGSSVEEALTDMDFKGKCLRFGWPNAFIPHGSYEDLCQRYGLTEEALAARVVKALQ